MGSNLSQRVASTSRDAAMIIGGAWTDAAETLPNCNPSTGKVIGRVAGGGAGDADRAVAAARAALPGWSATPPSERADVLARAAVDLDADLPAWSELMAEEMGKTLAEANAEASRAVKVLRYFAEETHRPFGEHYLSDEGRLWLFTKREPIGVVAIVTPWNFPVAIPAWKLAPALVLGNTCVLKLASDAPLSGLRLVSALVDAGLPPGALNVVLGPGATVGSRLVEHPEVDAVSFTGSTLVGREIVTAASRRGARVQAEMGGHSPVVVRADASLERAVAAVSSGAFVCAGQRCTATRRVYVARPVYDEFAGALAERARSLKVGGALSADTELGPLVNERQLEEVLGAVERAAAEGTVLAGGERATSGELAHGCFMKPTVVAGLPADAEMAREEIFGPAVAVWPFDDDAEAIELANRTEYGLSASIFTRDLDAARAFVESVRAGMVRVNHETAGAEVHVPFGGLGASGHGPREQGGAAIEFFTEEKTVYLNGADG